MARSCWFPIVAQQCLQSCMDWNAFISVSSGRKTKDNNSADHHRLPVHSPTYFSIRSIRTPQLCSVPFHRLEKISVQCPYERASLTGEVKDLLRHEVVGIGWLSRSEKINRTGAYIALSISRIWTPRNLFCSLASTHWGFHRADRSHKCVPEDECKDL